MIPMSPQISQCAGMRRDDICIYVSPSNRARLTALIDDRNTPSKVVWRAEIVLATADGHGTNEIMRCTGKSKPCVWRWQELRPACLDSYGPPVGTIARRVTSRKASW